MDAPDAINTFTAYSHDDGQIAFHFTDIDILQVKGVAMYLIDTLHKAGVFVVEQEGQIFDAIPLDNSTSIFIRYEHSQKKNVEDVALWLDRTYGYDIEGAVPVEGNRLVFTDHRPRTPPRCVLH